MTPYDFIARWDRAVGHARVTKTLPSLRAALEAVAWAQKHADGTWSAA